jgi:hypothetical protein
VWPYRHSGAGRREFRRLVLVSLAKSAREELERRRVRGQRLRARRALRRLEELERTLEQLELYGAPLPRPWHATRGATVATAAACVVALGGLAAGLAAYGPRGVVVGVADVAMLVATVVWFWVAVGRRATAPPPRPPSNEGSSEAGEGR